jgi:hypothetical protein
MRHITQEQLSFCFCLRDAVFVAALRRAEVDEGAIHSACEAGRGRDVSAADRVFLQFGHRRSIAPLGATSICGSLARMGLAQDGKGGSENRPEKEKNQERNKQPDEKKTNHATDGR